MKNKHQILCPSCEKGHLQSKITEYVAQLQDGVKITVPDVQLDICDNCGEIVMSSEAARKIDAVIAEQNEQLSPRELTNIREQFDLDQTEMSETLGLGEKTYHRWEKGTQIPSRSMCFYLRVLSGFPEAFDWLRKRQWHLANRCSKTQIDFNFSKAFPDLEPNEVSTLNIGFNPARALFANK